MTIDSHVDYPGAKSILIKRSAFRRGREYQHPRFVILDALVSLEDIDLDHPHHYYVLPEGSVLQAVCEEDTALSNAVGNRPEQFWYFASQHGQVDILSFHICLLTFQKGVTQEQLQGLYDLLLDLERRHRVTLVKASNNGGIALRSSLDIDHDMHGVDETVLDALLTALARRDPSFAQFPSFRHTEPDPKPDPDSADGAPVDQEPDKDKEDKDQDKDGDEPKRRGRPRKTTEE